MTNLLCFGDSNTWGFVPNKNRRYTPSERWPGLLSQYLPEEWCIVEEGQPGRTSLYEDASCGFSCGLPALKSALKQHVPQRVIIMLGTNDLKTSFGLSAEDISHSTAKLVEEIQSSGVDGSDILLVAPPPINEKGSFARLFFAGSEEKSRQLAYYYQQRAKELGCHFFDAGKVASACPDEGIHWQTEAHAEMAKAIAPILLNMPGEQRH
ncbi:G-D-S-L family lipolytic protein [Vibrio albus]|uniref:G-D-S-L family lipolytic protein n=1 Tax=Vibrio albus TaxID=2200953 RepID=A0A2U3B990_9VIBR|nr:SGNH/GDSL hydrolase family protein [Vibrio albus]PWI33360.1 G-D-S-L family lipolytic protein [Vibrio albus]